MEVWMRKILIFVLVLTLILSLAVYVFIRKNMGHGVSVPDPVRIRVKSQLVCRMVGSELTGDIGIVGTDLGIPVLVHVNGSPKIFFLFGDVISKQKPGANAMAYANYPINGCPDLRWFMDDGMYREMWGSLRKDGVDASTPPAGAVEIDGVLYVYGFRVTHWKKRLQPNDATHGYGVLFKRLGNGEFVETNVSWPIDSKFVNIAPVSGKLNGKNVVFLFSSGKYRDSPIYLAYVPADKMEDLSSYRYFIGLDDRGNPLWSNRWNDAKPIINKVKVGELSAIYHPYLKQYLLMFKDYSVNGGLQIRVAYNPWGPYSKPTKLNPLSPKPSWLKPSWGGLYGGYIVPGSYGKDGHTLYYVISLWIPYSTFLMRIEIEIP